MSRTIALCLVALCLCQLVAVRGQDGDLAAQNQALLAELSSAKQLTTSLQSQVASLQQQVERSAAELQSAVKQAQEAAISQLSQQAQELVAAKTAEMQKQVDAKDAELKAALAKLSEAQKQMAADQEKGGAEVIGLSNQIETLQREIKSLKSANADLTGSNKKKADDLAAATARASAAEEKASGAMSAANKAMKLAQEAQKDSEEQHAQDQKAIDAEKARVAKLQAELNKKDKELKELSSKVGPNHLFSYEQLTASVTRVWTLFSTSALHSYSTLRALVPKDVEQQVQDVLLQTEMLLTPHLEKAQPLLKEASQQYDLHAKAHVEKLLKQAHLAFDQLSAKATALFHTYTAQANGLIDHYLAKCELFAAYPQLKELVPPSLLDRVLAVLFLAFVVYASHWPARLAVRLACKTLSLALCVMTCGLCARRKSSQVSSVEKKKKKFYPEAAQQQSQQAQKPAPSSGHKGQGKGGKKHD